MELVPEVRELVDHAERNGKKEAATKVRTLLDEILNSEHHKWFLGLREKKTADAGNMKK